MDIRKRLIAPCATYSHDEDQITVDLSGFILRLILFEKFIFQSIRLKEFPSLIRAFGYDAVRNLLTSKAVDIHYDALTMGQTGQLAVLESRSRKGILPLGSYSFSIVRFADRKQLIHDCLQPLHKIEGLNNKQVIKLKREIVSRLLTPNPKKDDEIVQQLKVDLRSNVPHIKTTIAYALRERLKAEVNTSDFSIQIHPIDEDDFRTETSIGDVFRLSEEDVHQVVERGLLAIGGLNQRIAEMKAYTALSGFRDTEAPIFDQKLDFLSKAFSPEVQEDRFKRVHVLKGFQDLEELIYAGKVDLIKVLEIRETKQCKEFRDWLWSIDSATDAEIEEHINSLRENLSWFAHGKVGKSVRWLTSTGIGLIPGIGTMAGTVAGFLDTFLLEKVLPNPGPISFLNKLYPSIFKEDPMITPENFLKIK
jgi:hypothetical protein